MELENFQDIDNFPNYMINEEGMIYSKKRNKIMKPQIQSGYYRVILRNNNKTHNKSIHRLLGLQYLPNSNNYPCIDHKNRDKLDNSLSNLRWVTYSHNSKNKTSKQNSTSKFLGVRKTDNRTNPYRAETTYEGKKYNVGCYKTEEEAFEAYKKFNLEKFDIEIF